MKNKIIVQNQRISIVQDNYISLTDIAKFKNSDEANEIIRNWLRNRNTIEFLGLWEKLNNVDFKPLEFEGFKKEAGLNSFTMGPKKWCETTNAIGILSKSGRYGGTFAHQDIAAWISVEFKLYLIKQDEIDNHIHTEAIKNNLIPPNIAKNKISFIYATEADLLNVALFGLTAKAWSESNPKLEGNMRDYATAEQLVVLANLENLNAQLIKQNIPFEKRLIQLNEVAIEQLQLLLKYTKKLAN